MQEHISPTANGELRRELPCLEAGVVLEVMERFEEVEYYITRTISTQLKSGQVKAHPHHSLK